MLTYKRNIVFENLEQELEKLSEAVESLRLPPGFLLAVLYILSELFSNVKEHSKAKRMAARVRIGTKRGEIEISDNGIGLRRSYRNKKIYPKDDFSAIEFAISGLSTKEGQERGFGLYSIKQLTEALGGTLTLTSDFAKAVFQKNQITFHTLSRGHRGVSAVLTMPVKKVDFYNIV